MFGRVDDMQFECSLWEFPSQGPTAEGKLQVSHCQALGLVHVLRASLKGKLGGAASSDLGTGHPRTNLGAQ